MAPDTKQQILLAARDLFLEGGAAGLSMRKVAERVGVSATAIYRHYHSKDALIAAVVAEGFQLFGSYIFRALAGSTPLERLRASGRNYLEFAFDHPQYYQVIFLSGHKLRAEMFAHQHQAPDQYAPSFRFLLDRVEECRKAGALRRELKALDVAMLLWSQCHGLATLYLFAGMGHEMSREGYSDLCRAVLKQVTAGLVA